MIKTCRHSLLALAAVAVALPHFATESEPVLRVGLSGSAQQEQAAKRQESADTELQVAVVVLDPGIPESTKKQDQNSIWPELRKAEAIRSAVLIAEALRGLHMFETVRVVPDTSLTADLYLTGRIDLSDGERMRIYFTLHDIGGSSWFKEEEAFHRVEVGWYLRHDGDGSEPFQPVYDQIAERVHKALQPLIRAHVAQEKKNAVRAENRHSAKLSRLDRLVMTRRALFAQYFAPDRYAGIVTADGSKLVLQYWPNVDDQDWHRVEAIRQRDDAFSDHIHGSYVNFVSEIEESYHVYQSETFPIARALRLSRRSANFGKIMGAVLLSAALVQAADGMEGTGDRDRAKILAGLGTAALGAGLIRDAQKRSNLLHLNEVSKSFHDSVKSTRVDVEGNVVELTGTVQEQYLAWRQLLLEHHRREEQDAQAVQVVAE